MGEFERLGGGEFFIDYQTWYRTDCLCLYHSGDGGYRKPDVGVLGKEGGDCGGSFSFLIGALFLVGVFWLGFISPYSFELGWVILWCHVCGVISKNNLINFRYTLVFNLLTSDPCT